jgi:hypothetical protein
VTVVHYYLGRPAHVWIAASSHRGPARQTHKGSGRVRNGGPGQPAAGLTPSAHAAASGPPTDAPAGGLLARRRIAIARFGTDVAAAGGIGPALVAGLDPADYPVVPGGVPEAWERAQVYLGLCERYQELYQSQVAGLHLLMATMPAPSCPSSTS